MAVTKKAKVSIGMRVRGKGRAKDKSREQYEANERVQSALFVANARNAEHNGVPAQYGNYPENKIHPRARARNWAYAYGKKLGTQKGK